MQTDEEYLFHSDVREKKTTARSARNKRTHNGKGGRVKFPSDYMTKKELNAMNGKVESYKLNEPMTWKEFKAMPEDIRVTYVKLLREKFHVSDHKIGEMLGVTQGCFAAHLRKLGISSPKHAHRNDFDKEGWIAWCNGVPSLKEEVHEEPAEEQSNEIESLHIEEKKIAIPNSGSLMFEGEAESVMNTFVAIMGRANVRINITWEVVNGTD